MIRPVSLHLLDLGQNALEAGARHVRMSVTYTEEIDACVLDVRDDGRGMDETVRLRCQTAGFTTKKSPQAGHGLALLAADAQDGITVWSTPGQGTCVRTLLRRAAVCADTADGLARTLTALHAAGHGAHLSLSLRTGERSVTVWVMPSDTVPGAGALSRLYARLQYELGCEPCPATPDGGTL